MRLRSDFWKNPAIMVSTGLGSGFFPKAPGTFASFLTLILWWLLLSELDYFLKWGIVLVVGITGFWSIAMVAKYGAGDASEITIDEVLGQLVALQIAPNVAWTFVITFALFRLFDIWKPGIVGYVDTRFKNPAGVLGDDLFAGILAGLVAYLIYWLWMQIASLEIVPF